MASKFKMASKIGKRSGLKKAAIAGGVLAAVGAGVAQGDPVQYSMNAAQEAVFGTDQIDNMVLGADLRARDFTGIRPGFGMGVGKATAGGAGIGGIIGAIAGRGKIGKAVGAGIGAGIGGLIGGGAGFSQSDAYSILFPKENPASMFSGTRFNKVPFNYAKVNEEKNAEVAMRAAEYPFDETGDGIRGYSRYAGSTFPQRSVTRSWDSASGDIVLGSYNLRRG